MINKAKAFIILGNQLFSPIHLKSFKDHHFMMAEDYQLCTYVKHHRQKILLFLSAMRSYADELKKANFSLTYFDCKHELFKKSYEDKILNFLNKFKTKHISLFEVEDKFFETQLINFFKKNKIEYQFIKSPMFLSSRDDFKEYLKNNKKPFMANFYKIQRIKFNILMKSKNEPLGGKWSFDKHLGKKPEQTTDISDQEFAPVLAEYESKLEEARNKVDRIAFSGQVPVIVSGSYNVGDYILPIEGPDDTIVGVACSLSSLTLEDYGKTVGKVWGTCLDKAWVAVKIG